MDIKYAKGHMEEPGQLVVITDKSEAFAFLKKVLSQFYKRITQVTSLTEAKRRIASERVFLLFAFTPMTDGGLDEVMKVAATKDIPAVVVVGSEIYTQAIYRVRGSRVFVLTYPMKKGIVVQAVNIMYESQRHMRQTLREKEKLMERLNDLNFINRAKLLLIEKRGMSEDDAHHEVEHRAMELGLTRRRAADLIIEELTGGIQ